MSDLTPPEGLPDQPPASPPPAPDAGGPPPPPPPPPAYGAPPPTPAAGDQPFSVGAAFSWGWAKFQENLAPILIAVLIYFVIVVIVEIVAFTILGALFFSSATVEYDANTGAFTSTGGTGFVMSMFVYALTVLVFTVLFAFLQASVIRGGGTLADFFAAAVFEGELADAERTVLLTQQADTVARFSALCFLSSFISGEFKLAGWGEKNFFKLHAPSRVHPASSPRA